MFTHFKKQNVKNLGPLYDKYSFKADFYAFGVLNIRP